MVGLVQFIHYVPEDQAAHFITLDNKTDASLIWKETKITMSFPESMN